MWIPKATDGTSGLKGLAAPQLAQSSSSNGATVASQAQDSMETLAAPQPAQSSSSNGASVASQAQDSSYMDSENDGWHLGLERPRRAGPVMLSESDGWHLGLERPRRASAGPAFIQQWRQVASQDSSYVDSESRGCTPGLTSVAAPQPDLSSSSNGASVASQAQDSSYMASESDGWHLGPRRASAGPAMLSESDGWHLGLEASPRLSRPSLRPAMAPQWPARPRTAVLWIPKATDGTLGLTSFAAPQPAPSSSSNGATVASQAQDSNYMLSESDGWHLGLERPRRACARQWRQSLA